MRHVGQGILEEAFRSQTSEWVHLGESIGEVRDEAPGTSYDGGVCERHLEGAFGECNGKDGSGRMHLGRMEKTIGRGGIRRLERNIFVETHLEEQRRLETTALEKRSGRTSG